jgi:hypothetical protein
MTVTVQQFYVEFPEFARVKYELVSAKLADSEARVALDISGANPVLQPDGTMLDPARDMFVKYLTAATLALSPGGEFARLEPNKEPDGARSIYERTFNQLQASYNVLAMTI